MVFGTELLRNADDVIPSTADMLVPTGQGPLRFRRVAYMEILGVQISCDHKCPTHADVEFRIDAARKAFYSQASFFRNQSTLSINKFYRYQQRVQSLALYGAQGCTADSHSLHLLSAFEGKCLCFMHRCPRLPDESCADWNVRRYRTARSKFQEAGFSSLVQKFLRTQWL